MLARRGISRWVPLVGALTCLACDEAAAPRGDLQLAPPLPDHRVIAPGDAAPPADRGADAAPPADRGADAPPPTGEDFYATADHAFVSAATHQPVRFNGVNVQPIWSSSTSTWAQSHYDQIKARGFDHVRFVLFWKLMQPSRGSFDAARFATLATAVARAKSAGLYVILDVIHLYGADGGLDHVPAWAVAGGGDSVDIVLRDGIPYVREIVGRYADERTVVAYDLVNEPYAWPIDNSRVLQMYDTLIREVRAIDPDKIVHVEPTYGSSSFAAGCADFAKLTFRSNVVIHYHDYFAGGDDDGFAASGCGAAGQHTWDMVAGYPSPDRDALRQHLQAIVSRAREIGLPVYIGEYGIGAGGANHDRWIEDTVAALNALDLGRCWWEYGGSSPMAAINSDGSFKPWVDLLFAP